MESYTSAASAELPSAAPSPVTADSPDKQMGSPISAETPLEPGIEAAGVETLPGTPILSAEPPSSPSSQAVAEAVPAPPSVSNVPVPSSVAEADASLLMVHDMASRAEVWAKPW